jgi:hypothetical protein
MMTSLQKAAAGSGALTCWRVAELNFADAWATALFAVPHCKHRSVLR